MSDARSSRRLRRHGEFVRAQRSGRRVGTPHFTLLVAAQPPPPRPARLGLVVSRAVGSAVRRNRIKRLCRECFRLSKPLPDGVDLVVIARAGSPELDLEQVRAEWRGVQGLLKARAAEALARGARLQHAPPAQARTPAAPPRSRNKP